MNFTWGGNLKSVNDQGLIEGDGIVFGSEEKYDLSPFKDFFTPDTFVHPEQKFTTPLFLEHAFQYKQSIGKAYMYKTESGWKATAELDLENPIVKEKFDDIKKGGWGFSTGSSAHVVLREEKKDGTHHITQWPVAELSITKTPAEPTALIRNVKSLNEYYGESDNDTGEGEHKENQTIEYYKEMNENLLEIIRTLIENAANKHIEEIFNSKFESVSTEIEELKTILSNKGVNPDETQENTEELTVLKTELEDLTKSKEELESTNSELQSSFDEKEALLSEKMALLSETQAELDVKSQENIQLAEALKAAEEEIDKQKKVNSALAANFRK